MVGWLFFYGTRPKKGHIAPDTSVKVFLAKDKFIKEDCKMRSGWGFPHPDSGKTVREKYIKSDNVKRN